MVKLWHCIDCSREFDKRLNYLKHQRECVAALRKCSWIHMDGRKCRFRGRYSGFCKRHWLGDVVYNPEGLTDEDGGEEGCSHVYSKQINPTTIKSLEEHSEYPFIGRGNVIYEYIRSSLTTVTMKLVETDEEVLFWKDHEARGKKSGHLIKTLKTQPFDVYCENIAVANVDDEFYCKECFEKAYGCKIKALKKFRIKPTVRVEE